MEDFAVSLTDLQQDTPTRPACQFDVPFDACSSGKYEAAEEDLNQTELHARVRLSDGSEFFGNALGRPQSLCSEIVFNTATTGYQEALTDPSYLGQTLLFTTPHFATTGWAREDSESRSISPHAVICRKLDLQPHHHESVLPLHAALAISKTPILHGFDTRALVLKLRSLQSLKAQIQISSRKLPWDHVPLPQVELEVISPLATFPKGSLFFREHSSEGRTVPTIVVIDFGCKDSIVQQLTEHGARVITFPWNDITVDEIVHLNPDGLLFSNGPGDPRTLLNREFLLKTYHTLSTRYPTFGICYGHQILGLVYGAKVGRVAFGHHAINHPVGALTETGQIGRVYITSQNHNYAVEDESLPSHFVVTHRHLNDHTVAGIRHQHLPISSVQFHPEAGPGPRDAHELFAQFLESLPKQEYDR